MVKEGKIRKQKKLPTIKDDEVPYGLPGGWEWVRFGNVMHLIMGQSPPGTSYNKVGNGVPLINGPVEFGPKPLSKTIINQYTTSPNKMCKKGDLLLCVRGSTTGRTNIAGYDGCIGRGVASIRAYMYQQYLYLFILSKREHLLHLGRGIAFPSIKKDMLKLLLCPLPPLPEQKRIFTKYKKLMSLCDQLEANIEQSQKHSGKLLNAVIHEVLTG